MIRRVLMCLPLLAVAAAAQENFPFETATAAALQKSVAQSRPQTVKVDRCWSRKPADAVLDSAKLPVDFCLRAVTVSVIGDGGSMSVNGAYTPAGAAARAALSAAPQPMSSYKESTGGRVYSAYIFEDRNAHGDTGAVFVSFAVDKDGRLVADSVWANFSVGCPQEECQEGEEPGVRVSSADWP